MSAIPIPAGVRVEDKPDYILVAPSIGAVNERTSFGLLPGFGQESKNYLPFAANFARQGVLGFIGRWYGRYRFSEEGMIDSVYDSIEDVSRLIGNGTRFFLFGHSNGGEWAIKSGIENRGDKVRAVVAVKPTNGLPKNALWRDEYRRIKLIVSGYPRMVRPLAYTLRYIYSIPRLTGEALLEYIKLLESDPAVTNYVEKFRSQAGRVPPTLIVRCPEEQHVSDDDAIEIFNAMKGAGMPAQIAEVRHLKRHVEDMTPEGVEEVCSVGDRFVRELMVA